MQCSPSWFSRHLYPGIRRDLCMFFNQSCTGRCRRSLTPTPPNSGSQRRSCPPVGERQPVLSVLVLVVSGNAPETNPERDQNSRNHIPKATPKAPLNQRHPQHKSAPSQPQIHKTRHEGLSQPKPSELQPARNSQLPPNQSQ